MRTTAPFRRWFYELSYRARPGSPVTAASLPAEGGLEVIETADGTQKLAPLSGGGVAACRHSPYLHLACARRPVSGS